MVVLYGESRMVSSCININEWIIRILRMEIGMRQWGGGGVDFRVLVFTVLFTEVRIGAD